MVLNVEMQEIYAEGDVLFDEEAGNAFYCDQLTFNYQEWKGLAKNVRIKMDREGVDLPVMDFLDTPPSTGMGSAPSINDAGAQGAQLKRMYAQARELRAHDSETFELIDAKITPSSFAKPHWYFNSPAALYRQKEKIESYHNTVRVGGAPVLYFPYLIRDLQYDWPWMRITMGSTGDYGYFARTQWGWRLQERPNAFLRADKIIFDLDLFTRRGIGVGAETTYKAGDWDSLGKLKVYGVWEFLTSRGRDEERAYGKNENRIYRDRAGWQPDLYRDKFRWAIDWEHYQQLNDFWDVRAQAHLYHDRDYLREYDPTRYWNAKEPENSINLRRLDRQWEFEILASSPLTNKWSTQAEYLPEARLTVPSIQIGDTQLFFKNDMRVGLVNKQFDEDRYRFGNAGGLAYADGLFNVDPMTGHSVSRLYDKDNYGTFFRAFNEMRVEAPLKLWDSFTLKPWVGLRTAYYSQTAGEDRMPSPATNPNLAVYNRAQRYGGTGGDYDIAVPFGAELSTRIYTLFGASEQWRLISEPVVSWTENTSPRINHKEYLLPIDYYDEYRRERRFGYEMHWKLQRRYFEDSSGKTAPERDILDVNVAVNQYPREKDRGENNNRAWTDITADAIYRPFKNLALTGSIDYDPHANAANRAIVGVDWRMNNYLRTSVTHYHYRGRYWRYPDSDPSSQTHMAVRTKLWNDSSHYSLEGAVAYEWRDSTAWITERDGVRHGFNKYRVTLFRDLDTFELGLSYVRDRNADDHGVFFNLSPKAFMGYDRPPPGYSMEIEELAEGRYARQSRFLDDGYLIDAPARDADIKDVQF